MRRLALLAIFAVATAYFEAAVVVYLRQLYYPEGFAFPLKLIPNSTMLVEIGRELATVVMLTSVAVVVVRRRWERFGWFLFMFGFWDVWYYIWLKVILNWPASLFDWDVLFLIPIPWISPVIAPLLVAVTMILIGPWIVLVSDSRDSYRPGVRAWVLGLLGSASILYSFMSDPGAIFNQKLPQSYSYWLLTLGLGCYWIGFLSSIRPLSRQVRSGHE